MNRLVRCTNADGAPGVLPSQLRQAAQGKELAKGLGLASSGGFLAPQLQNQPVFHHDPALASSPARAPAGEAQPFCLFSDDIFKSIQLPLKDPSHSSHSAGHWRDGIGTTEDVLWIPEGPLVATVFLVCLYK